MKVPLLRKPPVRPSHPSACIKDKIGKTQQDSLLFGVGLKDINMAVVTVNISLFP
jgi:hypothetical protein